MSLVIARDGKVFVVANAETLTPEQAYDLGAKIKQTANKAFRQREKLEKAEKRQQLAGDEIQHGV